MGGGSLKQVGEDGGYDDEGRPIHEKVDLMETFFHRQI